MKKIMTVLLVSVTVLSFTNCEQGTGNNLPQGEERAEYVCNCQQRDKVAEFVQTSIKNANNMSDEEMEDVIKELRHTAVKIYCPMKNIQAVRNDFGEIKKLITPLDSCEQIMEY